MLWSRSLLLLAVALPAVMGGPKGFGLQRRTGEDDKDKKNDSFSPEFSPSSILSTVFQESEPSFTALIQTSSAYLSRNTAPVSAILVSTADKISNLAQPSEDSLVLVKDKSLATSVSEDQYSLPLTVPSKDREPTSQAYQDKDKDKDKAIQSQQSSAEKKLPTKTATGKDKQAGTAPAKDEDRSQLQGVNTTKSGHPLSDSTLAGLSTSLTLYPAALSAEKKHTVTSSELGQHVTNILSIPSDKDKNKTIHTETDKITKVLSSSAAQFKDHKPSSPKTSLSSSMAVITTSVFYDTSSVARLESPTGPPMLVYTITIPIPAAPSSFGSWSSPEPSHSLASILYPSMPTSIALSAQGSLGQPEFPGYRVVPAPSTAPDKHFPSNTTSIIPVWTPELLGGAYGGGFIRTPSIYVTKLPYPNGPSHGLPPGYGTSNKLDFGASSSQRLLSLSFEHKNETQTFSRVTPVSKSEKYKVSKDYKPEGSQTLQSLVITPLVSVVQTSYTPTFGNKTSKTVGAYSKDHDTTSKPSPGLESSPKDSVSSFFAFRNLSGPYPSDFMRASFAITTPTLTLAIKPHQSFKSFLNSSTVIRNVAFGSSDLLPTSLKDISYSTSATKKPAKSRGENILSPTSLKSRADDSFRPSKEVISSNLGFQPLAKNLPSQGANAKDNISTGSEQAKTEQSSSSDEEAKKGILLSGRATKSESFISASAKELPNAPSSYVVSFVSGLSNVSQTPKQPLLSGQTSDVQQPGSPSQAAASAGTPDLSDKMIPTMITKKEDSRGFLSTDEVAPNSLVVQQMPSHRPATSALAITSAAVVPVQANDGQLSGLLETSNAISGVKDSTLPMVAYRQESSHGGMGTAQATPYSLALRQTPSYGPAVSALAVASAAAVPLTTGESRPPGLFTVSIDVPGGKDTKSLPLSAIPIASATMPSQAIQSLTATDTSISEEMDIHFEGILVTLSNGIQAEISLAGSSSMTAIRSIQFDKPEDRLGVAMYLSTSISFQQSLDVTPTRVSALPGHSLLVEAPNASSTSQILQDKGTVLLSQAIGVKTTGKIPDKVSGLFESKLMTSSFTTSNLESSANGVVSSEFILATSSAGLLNVSGVPVDTQKSQGHLGHNTKVAEIESKPFNSLENKYSAPTASSIFSTTTNSFNEKVLETNSPMPSGPDTTELKSRIGVAGAAISASPDIKTSSSGSGNVDAIPSGSGLANVMSESSKPATVSGADKIESSVAGPRTSLRHDLGSSLTNAVVTSLGKLGPQTDLTGFDTIIGSQRVNESESDFSTAETRNLVSATGLSHMNLNSLDVGAGLRPTGEYQGTTTSLPASGTSRLTGNDSVMIQLNPTAIRPFQGGAAQLSATLGVVLLSLLAFFPVL